MTKKKIFLDPGHYGRTYNAGAVSGYYESDVMWELTMLEKEYLEQMGIEVVLSKDTVGEDPEVSIRGLRAKGCDLAVSNHTNACDTPSADRAVVIRFVDNDDNDLDEKSTAFAKKLAKVIRDTMGVKDYEIYSRLAGIDRNNDGELDDNWYGVLYGFHEAGVVGVIAEHSFHTNPAACRWLMKEDNLKKLAKACAICMAEYVGVSAEAATTKPQVSDDKENEVAIKAGDVVSIKPGAKYYTGADVPDWVEKQRWIVNSIKGDRAVIDKSEDGKSSIMSAINVKYLTATKTETKKEETFKSYVVRVAISNLNIRKGPGTNYGTTGSYTGKGSFTIVDEKKGQGSKAGWGKLKSGAGWISLDYATKI